MAILISVRIPTTAYMHCDLKFGRENLYEILIVNMFDTSNKLSALQKFHLVIRPLPCDVLITLVISTSLHSSSIKHYHNLPLSF